ncbi:GntR family transcriptional regulator [Streptomyces mirabilis]|uniref:GntR family transcriptional regulator n=1 Tax=Streptomyces mirabilis TaxID=68239 RepID=UPI0036AB1D70
MANPIPNSSECGDRPLNASAHLSDDETRLLDPKRAGQAGRVHRGLQEAITEGIIPPGVLLVSADLASGYKVDSHVVAVALRGLAHNGLVQLHHLGAKVSDAPIAPPIPHLSPRQARSRIELTIRRRLATRIYQPGSMLPRQRVLAKEFGVSPAAYRRAIEPLVEEGFLIPSVNPKGTRVSNRLPHVETVPC